MRSRRRRRGVRARRAAVVSDEAALVLRQGPERSSRHASSISRRCPMATARCCSPRSRPRPTAKPTAGSCRSRSIWDDEPALALPSQLALARVRRGPAHRAADRRLRAAGLRACRMLAALADKSRDRDPGGDDRLRADRERRNGAAAARECAGALAHRRAVEQLADRRRCRDAEDLPQGIRRDASRSGDEPLPDRAGLRQHAADARRDRARRERRRALLARGGAGLCAQSGRCLDLDARSVQPRARRYRDARSRPTTQSRTKLPTTPPSQPRSGGGSAKCMRCLRADADDAAFAPETAERTRCRSMGRARDRPARARVRLAQEAIELGERDGRGRSQAAAVAAGSADARAAQARQGGHRQRRKPASTATSTSGRCWSRAATSTSSTSRASPADRSPSAAPRRARCAMSPACCAPSITRRPRRSIPKSIDGGARPARAARRVCRRACATARSARSSMRIRRAAATPAAASCSTSS